MFCADYVAAFVYHALFTIGSVNLVGKEVRGSGDGDAGDHGDDDAGDVDHGDGDAGDHGGDHDHECT